MATVSYDKATRMGHRVAVLDGGVLQQVDTPRKLYDEPVNVFVAGFIGSPARNIKTVPLTDEGGQFAGMLVPLTREQVAAARADGTEHVQIGFRPEDTEIVGEADGGMPVRVDLIEELGSDAYVYGTVALEGHDERFVVRAESRRAPRLGEIVHLRPRVGAHHAFQATTGERL
ncbi:TOBE domain-containing protein [Actinoplanes subtropicus]|uniref:TOBE domain-containing protein n=1 Tax=Actinoplanes subtropicus TaxID=543632 RepID=UPI000A03925A